MNIKNIKGWTQKEKDKMSYKHQHIKYNMKIVMFFFMSLFFFVLLSYLYFCFIFYLILKLGQY